MDELEFYAFTEFHGCYPLGIIDIPIVLHIAEEDIFIDVNFSAWTSGASGGGFSYTRSTPQE